MTTIVTLFDTTMACSCQQTQNGTVYRRYKYRALQRSLSQLLGRNTKSMFGMEPVVPSSSRLSWLSICVLNTSSIDFIKKPTILQYTIWLAHLEHVLFVFDLRVNRTTRTRHSHVTDQRTSHHNSCGTFVHAKLYNCVTTFPKNETTTIAFAFTPFPSPFLFFQGFLERSLTMRFFVS